jgi:protein phosphatase
LRRHAAGHQTRLLPETRLPDISPRPQPMGNGTPTTPLSPPTAPEPLPEGALLADRYVIGRQLEGPPGVFVYQAEDTGDAPYGVACLIKDAPDEAALAGELAARSRIAPGDGVRPPYDAFSLSLRAGRGPRVFVVGPLGRPFEALEWPLEPAAALNAAAPLARGLAAVHAAGLAFGALDGRVQSDGALFLADFTGLGPGAPAAYEADVRALAGLVYRMLTGRAEAMPGVAAPLADRLAALMSGRSTTNAADLAALLSTRANSLRRPESLDLRVGRRTDVGQLRELNEDSLLTLDLVWSNKSISRPLGLFVVADGMGGHEGGEVASGLLVRAVAQHAASELLPRTTAAAGEPLDFGAWLSAAIQAGNVEVFERSETAGTDMGTTVVAALVAGNEAYVAHVGDSRAYRINDSGIEQITVDHSLVESLVASNQITREEARHHPQSNVIYRTIGDKRQVTVDLDLVTLAPGDSLLLCSDGLSGMLSDDQLQRLVATAASPQAACDALIDAANRAGGEDNITAIVIRAEALA